MIVIGSANSSNTRALEKLAREAGCARVERVNAADEISDALLDGARIVGVTAGASAPNELVEEVIALLDPARRRGAGAGDRGGRVLPAAAQPPRAADGDRRGGDDRPRRLARPAARPPTTGALSASDVLAALTTAP